VKKVFQFSAICTIGTALAISACTLVSVPLFGQGVIQPVKVVNTPNVNVVNTPSVSVSNTPNVSVTNTPNVSIANTPSVNVANTPTVTLEAGASVNVTSPLDGEGNPTPLAVLDAIQPYEDYCNIAFSGDPVSVCLFQTIPSGKRLVVLEFDASGQIETGLKPVIVELATPVEHFFTATFMGTSGGIDFFATHQETRQYVAPGEIPVCAVSLTGNSSQAYFCNLSGFLVDVPLGSSSASAPSQRRRVPALPNGRKPLPGRQ